MGSQFSTAQVLPRHDDAFERRSRMRALHARHRSRRSGMRRHVREGLRLGWYLLRLTVHAAGFALLLLGMFVVMFLI